MQILFGSLLLVVLANCSSGSDGCNLAFVKKNDKYNWDLFSNTAISTRGTDANDNPVYFVSPDLRNASKSGPYIVTLSKKTGEVLKTSCHLMSDSTNFNKSKMNALVLSFVKIEIQTLKVDESGNVFININNPERPNLVKFSDLKYKTGQYEKDWKNVKGLWYEDINNCNQR